MGSYPITLSPYQQWIGANPQCIGPGGIICPVPPDILAQSSSYLPTITISDPAVQAAVNNPQSITYQTVGAYPTTLAANLQSYLLQNVATLNGRPTSYAASLGITDTASANAWVLSIANAWCGESNGNGCDTATFNAAVNAAQSALAGVNFNPPPLTVSQGNIPGISIGAPAAISTATAPPATNAAATVAPAAPGKVNTTVPTQQPTSTSPGGPGTGACRVVSVNDPAAPGATNAATIQGSSNCGIGTVPTYTASTPQAAAPKGNMVMILAIAVIAFVAFK